MTKAILVIDEMPEACYSCQFCEEVDDYIIEEYFCQACRNILACDIYTEKDNKCPLKQMPEKKYVGEIKTCSDYMKSDISRMVDGLCARIALDTDLLLATGYNACIDEILGEE